MTGDDQGPLEEASAPLAVGPGEPVEQDLAGPLPTDPEPSSPPRRLYIAAGCVLVVALVLALAAPRIFNSSDEEAGGGGGGRATPSISDDFDRSSPNGLGSVDGQEWEAVSGSFAIEDGAAVVDEPNDAGPRSITLLDAGATNARIEATVGRATPSWGIVFRYVNPFNYWYLQAAPDYAVLNVVRMVNGQAQVIGATDLASTADGAKVAVVLDGSSIDVQVDDVSVFLLTNDHCLGATKTGLLGIDDASGVSWEAFRITPNAENPGPTEIKLPPEESTTESTDDTTTTERPSTGAGSTTTTKAPGG